MPENVRKPYYVEYLARELATRKAKNARYSMRAFAKHLGMDISALSRILAVKQELSIPTAIEVAKRLGLPRDEMRLFLASVVEEKSARTSMLLAAVIDMPSTKSERELTLLSKEAHLPKLDQRAVDEGASSNRSSVITLPEDFVSVFDSSGRFLHVNLPTANALGVEPCEMIGRSCEDFAGVTSPTFAVKITDVQNVFATGETHKFETHAKREGQIFWYQTTLSPLLGPNRQIRAVVASVRNITDRKRLEVQFDFATRISKKMSSVDGPTETVHALAQMLVPEFADWCCLHLEHPARDFGTFVWHCEEKHRQAMSRLLERHPSAAVVRGFSPGFGVEQPELQAIWSVQPPFAELGLRSKICVSLNSRGRSIGTLMIGQAESARSFTRFDLELAQEIGNQAGIALDLAFECDNSTRAVAPKTDRADDYLRRNS